ncbi:MAG: hypothetical protein Q9222_003862 [Ikaeria aurantiellina]
MSGQQSRVDIQASSEDNSSRSPQCASGSRQLCQGSMGDLQQEGMRSFVIEQAKLYGATNPGRDTIPSNVSLHNSIKQLMQGRDYDFNKLSRIYTQIEYRMKMMTVADTFVSALDLRGPGEVSCLKWNIDCWASSEEARMIDNKLFQKINRIVLGSHLIPNPLVKEGKQFTKPSVYISMALAIAKIDGARLDAAMKELVGMKDRVIAGQTTP